MKTSRSRVRIDIEKNKDDEKRKDEKRGGTNAERNGRRRSYTRVIRSGDLTTVP